MTLVVAAVYRQTGFIMQTRYVLPFAVVLPLWAGELLNRQRERLGARAAGTLLLGVFGTAAVVHALAWYANGRVVAAGPDAGWRFVSGADWVPPLGWWAWIATALVGAAAYALAGVAAGRAAGAR